MTKFALTAAVAASLSALVAVPAAAETFTVAYGDLDLSTPAGTEALVKRVETSAATVCERPDIRSVKAMAVFESCKTTVVSNAVDQLNRAGVALAVAQN